MKYIIMIFLTINLIAGHPCDMVKKNKKGEAIPESWFTNNNVGTVVDASFMKLRIGKTGWYIIDSRLRSSVVLGRIPKSIHLPSWPEDYKRTKSIQEDLVEIITKKSNNINQGRFPSSQSEIKNFKYITFCGGIGCHRSVYTACLLKEDMGVNPKNIFIMTGGFSRWIELDFPYQE